MGRRYCSLLRHLKKTVTKMRFLFNIWRMKASNISRRSSKQRRFRFKGQMGLQNCFEEKKADGELQVREYRRTRSYASEDSDDIDKRAEIFIAKFRRQLSMERQVSLQLRYCRTGSFEGDRYND